MGYIYIHTNTVNGKKYVGQTVKKPSYRWREGKGYSQNEHFYSAIQKYGWDKFKHETFEVCTPLLDFMERHLITLYETTSPQKGYNSEHEGKKYKVFTEEAKKRMSESHKGKNMVKCQRRGKEAYPNI